jgi:hypothetical protein
MLQMDPRIVVMDAENQFMPVCKGLYSGLLHHHVVHTVHRLPVGAELSIITEELEVTYIHEYVPPLWDV